MMNLANALIEALLSIGSHHDEASRAALKSIIRHLDDISDQEAAALRTALLDAAEAAELRGARSATLLQELEEALFSEEM